MDHNPNVAILRDCYTRWHDTRGGSIDAWLAIAHEQFTLRSMADGRQGVEFTAACSCKDDLGRYLSGLTGGWDMEYYQVDEYIAQGDAVIALGSTAWTNKTTGKRAETLKSDVWKFRDGKAVSFLEFYDSFALIEAGR
jgi:ketosteroid isomerase-like protein